MHSIHSPQELPKTVLISIKPCFVAKILNSEKRLEFRKSWAKDPVDTLVIYSTSPVQRIVATAKVIKITEGSPTELCKLANEKGDSVNHRLIYDYFYGKKSGVAIEIAEVKKFEFAIDPKKIFIGFRPPQSFKYLSPLEYNQIINTNATLLV